MASWSGALVSCSLRSGISSGAWDFWDFCAYSDTECRELLVLVLVQPQLWNTWASLRLMWEGFDHALTLLQSSGCHGFIYSLW